MAITILNQAVLDMTPAGQTNYTLTGFNIPPGTDTLILVMAMRGGSATVASTITSVTQDAVALTAGVNNFAAGSNLINTWAGYRRAPSIGTFNIVVNCNSVRGGAAYMLALDGVKSTGNPFGITDLQRSILPDTDTVGLGLTPTAGSLLTAILGISEGTTLLSWTGTGFVEEATGRYSGGDPGLLTLTARYRLDAPASTNTVAATFGFTASNIGGSLIEILAEATTGVDVTGQIAINLAITGQVGDASTARIANASFVNGKFTWTEVLLVQPDVVGVDRRIITAGPVAAPNYTLDMVQAGTVATNIYRWRYRLVDGLVTVETGAGTQMLPAHVIALVHRAGNPLAYVDGVESVSSRSGNARVGALDIGSGGLAIAGHDQPSPSAYAGLIGRYLQFDGALSERQLHCLTMSLLDPDKLWGYGAENDAQVVNRSPVALPMLVEPDGRPTLTITPRTVDPDGTQPTLMAVTNGAHTTVAISGSQLVLNFERGWQGLDAFTYTANDISKSSTGKVTVNQRRPALLARDDAVAVADNASIVFDPRTNDVGAGPLRIISMTTPSTGTAIIEPDGRIRYTTNPAAGAPQSEDAPLPASTGNLSASNAATLTSQIAAAAGGNHITLTGTTYGAFTISRDFSAQSPLVIKASTRLAPTFTKLTVNGNGIIISGITVAGGNINDEAAVYLNGDDLRLTRSEVRNARSVIRKVGGQRAMVDHCDLHIFRWRGIFGNGAGCRLTIARCYIHDGRDMSGGSGDLDLQLLSVVAFGSAFPNRTTDVSGIMRFNFIDNINSSSSGSDIAHNKARNSIYAFNKYAGGEAFYNRNGVGAIWVGNDAPGVDLVLTDYDQLAIGNRVQNVYIRGGNSPSFARTEAGSCGTWDCQSGSTSTQYACRDARVGRNTVSGATIVGKASSGEQNAWCGQNPTPANATQIRDQSGTITLQAGIACTPSGGSWHTNNSIQAGTAIPTSWYQGQWWALNGNLPTYTSAPQSTSDVGPNRAGNGGL